MRIWLVLISTAQAVPPLVPAVDVAERGLGAWWREGDLLVGVADVPGRPGIRPLAGSTPVELPADLSGWEPIGESCRSPVEVTAQVNGHEVMAEVAGTWEWPVVRLWSGGRVVAQNALGRPAQACDIRIVQADDIPGPEIVVAWRLTRAAVDAAARSVATRTASGDNLPQLPSPPKTRPKAALASEPAAGSAARGTRTWALDAKPVPPASPSTGDAVDGDADCLRGITVYHVPDTAF